MRRPTAPDPMADTDGSSVDGEEPAVVTDESSASSMGELDKAGEQENDGDAQGYEDDQSQESDTGEVVTNRLVLARRRRNRCACARSCVCV